MIDRVYLLEVSLAAQAVPRVQEDISDVLSMDGLSSSYLISKVNGHNLENYYPLLMRPLIKTSMPT